MLNDDSSKNKIHKPNLFKFPFHDLVIKNLKDHFIDMIYDMIWDDGNDEILQRVNLCNQTSKKRSNKMYIKEEY